jgi:hypothetical protein
LAYHLTLLLLILAFGTLLIWRPLPGWLDFWNHAAVGRWICQGGHVPDQSLFLWTAHEPWIYHSWLSQVVFYAFTRVAGSENTPYVVLGGTAMLALTPFVLAWLIWRGGGRLSSWLAIPFLLALKALGFKFQARPELFTCVCLCLLLTFLITWSRKSSLVPRSRDKMTAVGIFGLLVVWANFHGAVIIGLVLLAITAGFELLQDWFSPRSRLLALLALSGPVAVCLNPYGLAYWGIYRTVASETFASIDEWQPIWQDPPVRMEQMGMVGVLAALALGAWAFNPKRRWAQLAWLLFLGVLFAQARRNVWPFSLASLMVLAANAPSLDPQAWFNKLGSCTRRRSAGDAVILSPAWRWLLRLGLIAWVSLQCLLFFLAPRSWWPLTPTRLEQGVVHFIQANELRARVFNDYENSGFLQWSLAGEPALYIDKLNAYPDAVMHNYLAIMRATEESQRLLDEEAIEIVVLTTNRGSGAVPLAPLAAYLDGSANWARVCASKGGVIWVRRSQAYEHLWKPLAKTVSSVPFGTLEMYGHDEDALSPPMTAEDIGGTGRN